MFVCINFSVELYIKIDCFVLPRSLNNGIIYRSGLKVLGLTIFAQPDQRGKNCRGVTWKVSSASLSNGRWCEAHDDLCSLLGKVMNCLPVQK